MDKELKKIILSDLYRYGYGICEKKIPFFTRKCLYGYKFTKILRSCKYYKNKNKIKFIYYRLLLDKYSLKFGFQISWGTEIGSGFYLGHLGNVVINSQAIIGKNVNISQGVTIGITNRGAKQGVPRIGDNVWIGANSTIVGGISIGNDVLIAPNTFVNFDIPDHSIVIGGKASVISRENATEKYINNRVEE